MRTKVEGAKATKLVIDGKAFGSTSKNRLKVKVEAGELSPGTHDLSLIVQPTSGPPLTKEKVPFKTCA